MNAPATPHVARARLKIDMHRVGEQSFLHNAASGALVAAELPMAAHVAVAEALAHGKLGAADLPEYWIDAGLALTAPPAFVCPVPYTAPCGAVHDVFQFADRSVCLRSEDPLLSRDIRAALSNLISETDQPPSICIDVVRSSDGYGVFHNETAVWGRAPFDLSRFHVLREVMIGLFGPHRLAASLHGSAIEIRGRAVLFVGPSGAGKTTLSLGLVAGGARLVADDHIALETSGTSVLAYPCKSELKPSAKHLPHLDGLANAEAGARSDAVLLDVPHAAPGTSLPIAALVFPRFEAGGDNHTSHLEPADVLHRLYHSGGRLIPGQSLGPLVDLVTQVPCLSLSFRDTEYSLSQCQGLVS